MERSIRYIRDNFFAARHYTCLDDLNQQALFWCDTTASNRPCPEDKSKTVQMTFLEEQPRLINLPDNPYPCDEVETISIGKTPYARFDLNDYSVPHTQVRKKLVIRATLDDVSILDGSNVVAKHKRSYDKAKQIECEEHIQSLASQKAQGRLARGQDRLIQSIDCAREFLESAAARGYSPKSISKHLLLLLDDYGASSLDKAMRVALEKHVPHPNSVRMILQKHREDTQEQPLATFSLSQDKRVTELVIKPHSLNEYDELNEKTTSEEGYHDI